MCKERGRGGEVGRQESALCFNVCVCGCEIERAGSQTALCICLCVWRERHKLGREDVKTAQGDSLCVCVREREEVAGWPDWNSAVCEYV